MQKRYLNPLVLTVPQPVLLAVCTLVVMVILSDKLQVDSSKVKVADGSRETRRAGM